jgi:hypothetical protein
MLFGSKTTSQQTQRPGEVNAQWEGLRDQLISMAMNKLKTGTDMSGYTASGINNINNASDATSMTRDNMLSARGLASSPIAGNADILSENARAGNVATFQNSIPVLQRDFANQDWTQALNLFNPRPQTVATQGTQETEQSPWGSILGALAGGAGAFLGRPKK